jgi:hypothetical protein
MNENTRKKRCRGLKKQLLFSADLKATGSRASALGNTTSVVKNLFTIKGWSQSSIPLKNLT